ncbi:RNA polymerase sigma factor [Thiovibrio sp. JS02]
MLAPHLNYLYRLAHRLTCASADAEDLVQDVLLKIYARRMELAAIESLRPWLAKVMLRTFLDQRRKLKRSPLSLLKFFSSEEGTEQLLETLASDKPDPAELLDQRLTNARLLKALRKLKEDQRVVCVLHDMEEYTLVEMEQILGTPIGTLKSRLHRARAKLRKMLLQGS